MEALRQYVVSVVAAAIICGIVTGFLSKGNAGQIIKLICGLFLAFTVIRPIAKIDITDLSNFSLSFSKEAAEAVALGENLSRESIAEIIKEETEAYILDKAAALNAAPEVEVTVSDEEPIIPIAARISGERSPYAKQQLQRVLEEELGISKENQLWTG